MTPRTCRFAVYVSKHLTDAQVEEMGYRNCDTGISHNPDGTATIEFDLAALALTEAVCEGVEDCDAVGLTVTGVGPIEAVLDPDIADRCGLSMEELLRRVGQSGVTHPKPAATLHDSSGGGFYRWSEVAQWLAAHGVPQGYDKVIAAVDQAVKGTARRDAESLVAIARGHLAAKPSWQMPSWMVPYAPLISNTGGTGQTPLECAQTVETLMTRLRYERNLSRTNLYVFVMASSVHEQVGLLTRLHADGLLSPVVPA